MEMPGRKYDNGSGYRYGFNGKENDKDITAGDLDFGSRIYDGRLGRWLSVDKLFQKYPAATPYLYADGNPIIYIDTDGNDYVWFNCDGVEVGRKESKTVFVTYIQTGTKTITENGHNKLTALWKEVPMPNRITTYSAYENAKGYDYNKYDYEIAAKVGLLNERKKIGEVPQKQNGAGHPADAVPNLNPNTVKAMMLSESSYGTDTRQNGTVDVMQANVSGDFDKNKTKAGFTQAGIVDDYHQSISGGILWLYLKGIKVENVKYSEDGKTIIGGDVTWVGGADWRGAVTNYNGGGDPAYMPKYDASMSALSTGTTREAVSDAAKAAAKASADSLKTKKTPKRKG